MIDEVVCSDWEVWKGWGSPQEVREEGSRKENSQARGLEGARSLGRGPLKPALSPGLQGHGQSPPDSKAQESTPQDPVTGSQALAGLGGSGV